MTEEIEEEYVPITSEQSAAIPEHTKLTMLKKAKMGSWYDNWKPYCCTCSSISRMIQHDYGFKCPGCGNMIGWDLYRLVDSPLNRFKLK